MRNKFTLLATLFTLLIGFQTVQAQEKRATTVKGSQKIENISPSALAPSPQVQGAITIAGPLSQRVSALQCSNIEVQIGQNETPKSGLQITIFKVVASVKATGNISTGKCSYAIRNPSGLTVKPYQMRLATNTNAACPYSVTLGSVDDPLVNPSITFPTGDKVETRDFTAKPSCNN